MCHHNILQQNFSIKNESSCSKQRDNFDNQDKFMQRICIVNPLTKFVINFLDTIIKDDNYIIKYLQSNYYIRKTQNESSSQGSQTLKRKRSQQYQANLLLKNQSYSLLKQKHSSKKISNIPKINQKNKMMILKEMCQKQKFQLKYLFTQQKRKQFHCQCFINGQRISIGRGSSKKIAKQRCSQQAYTLLFQSNVCMKDLNIKKENTQKLKQNIKIQRDQNKQQQYNEKKNYRIFLNQFVHKELKSNFTFSIIHQNTKKIAILNLGVLSEKGIGYSLQTAKNIAAFKMYKTLQKIKDSNNIQAIFSNQNQNFKKVKRQIS